MKLPKNYKIWVTMTLPNETKFIISSSIVDRSVYYLFKVNGENNYTQLGTSNNPTKLENNVFSAKYN